MNESDVDRIVRAIERASASFEAVADAIRELTDEIRKGQEPEIRGEDHFGALRAQARLQQRMPEPEPNGED